MYNNYSGQRADKYWHTRRRVDNRSKVLADKSTSLTASKYHYKRKSIPVINPSSSPISEQMLVQKSVRPTGTGTTFQHSSQDVAGGDATTKLLHPNMYINPHFRSNQNVDLHQNANAQNLVPTTFTPTSSTQVLLPSSIHNPGYQGTNNILTTSVHVNPSVFGSNNAGQLHLSPVKLNSLATKPPACDVGTDTAVEKNSVDVTRLIHVNPGVLSSLDNLPISASNASKSVHVNPNVFARLKSEVRKEKPSVCLTPKSDLSDTSNHRSLIAISRTKLVRSRKLNLDKSLPHQHVTPRTRLLSHAKFTVVSPLTKIVKSVRSKYKYIRKISATPMRHIRPHRRLGTSPLVKTKYKLDRRQQKTPSRMKKVHKYSLQYETSKERGVESNLQGILHYKRMASSSKSPFGNRVLRNVSSFQPTRVIITDRKLLKIGSTPVVKRSGSRCVQPSSVGSTLVRIGGILYKTSRTRLTRTNGATPRSEAKVVRKASVNRRAKFMPGHVVNVRGNRFLMDPSGKVLRRFSSDAYVAGREQLKRIDIGGATFVQKTPNVLIRNNTQSIRSLLSQMKQKSIAMLSKQMRKNNTICKFYRRFGRCYRNEKGRCACVHDKKYVAICKSYLLGKCTNAECLLSHDLVPGKMPTCKYFLQACCARDDCPYLHVKLNAQASLCLGFLQGYCDEGMNCRKWHFNICPQFDKTGKCPKGKYCPFPHKPRKYMELSVDHLIGNVERIMKIYEDHLNAKKEKKSGKIFRYFNIDKNVQSLMGSPDNLVDSSVSSPATSDEDGSDSMSKRKIGVLPSFIPLN